jgi:SAM-dependent methyltransferase
VSSDEQRRREAIDEITPYVEKARTFSGWTFDELDVRHLDARMPWDYVAIAREHASRARSIVDLGTGGGDRYSTILGGRGSAQPGAAVPQRHAVATEEWHVNAPVARDRLGPLGVDVVRADSLRLPFADGAFDLVLDRHEALEPPEVARVLRPGGRVITQQVGHDTWPELQRFFPAVEFPDHFRAYQVGFRAAGMTIEDARCHEERVAFVKLGELVYMMLLTPDMFPGFDPIAEIDAVLAMEDALRGAEGIMVTETHYLLVARKALDGGSRT